MSHVMAWTTILLSLNALSSSVSAPSPTSGECAVSFTFLLFMLTCTTILHITKIFAIIGIVQRTTSSQFIVGWKRTRVGPKTLTTTKNAQELRTTTLPSPKKRARWCRLPEHGTDGVTLCSGQPILRRLIFNWIVRNSTLGCSYESFYP